MSNLLRMVYVSTTTRPVKDGSGIQVDVGRILMQARKNNPALKIGGVLYFNNNYFFQCLEGDQQDVNQLFQKISEDPRHKDVQTVSVKRISERRFADWSMKYVTVDEHVMTLLQQHGLSEFKPYEFDEDMIDKMLGLFVDAKDTTGKPDQDYAKTDNRKYKPGLLSRLFGKRKAA